MFKTLRRFLCIIFLFLILPGCARTIEPIEPNPDPTIVPMPEDGYFFFIEMDSDYDLVTASMEQTSYPLSTERIYIDLQNGRPGKGFHYFHIPLIDWWSGESWVRLSYYPFNYYHEDGHWLYCGRMDTKDVCYSTRLTFFPESVLEELIPGRYRFVIFVGDRVLYQEFEFTY